MIRILGILALLSILALPGSAMEAPRTVALSGGTFQNLRLLASVRRSLAAQGFRVLEHRRVPPNDAGISYGQAAIAAARLDAGAPPGAGERRGGVA